MANDRWADVNAIAFRVHGEVTDRHETADGTAVLDVTVREGLLLSILDPDERYPPDLVGERRTLAVRIDGFPTVEPAPREEMRIWVPDEGRLGLVSRRTAQSAWDGETLSVPVDAGFDVAYVPLRETTRPRDEPEADREILTELGIENCEYVRVEGARPVLHAVDREVETDPWAGVVFDDVTFEVDATDDYFRNWVRTGTDVPIASVRVALGNRWLVGDADRFGPEALVDAILPHLLSALAGALDGESAVVEFLASPALTFDPVEPGVARVNYSPGGSGRCLDPRFPPEGALVDVEAFARAALHGSRALLGTAEEPNADALDGLESLREAADVLERRLEA